MIGTSVQGDDHLSLELSNNSTSVSELDVVGNPIPFQNNTLLSVLVIRVNEVVNSAFLHPLILIISVRTCEN